MVTGRGHAGAVLDPRSHLMEIISADLAAEGVDE